MTRETEAIDGYNNNSLNYIYSIGVCKKQDWKGRVTQTRKISLHGYISSNYQNNYKKNIYHYISDIRFFIPDIFWNPSSILLLWKILGQQRALCDISSNFHRQFLIVYRAGDIPTGIGIRNENWRSQLRILIFFTIVSPSFLFIVDCPV